MLKVLLMGDKVKGGSTHWGLHHMQNVIVNLRDKGHTVFRSRLENPYDVMIAEMVLSAGCELHSYINGHWHCNFWEYMDKTKWHNAVDKSHKVIRGGDQAEIAVRDHIKNLVLKDLDLAIFIHDPRYNSTSTADHIEAATGKICLLNPDYRTKKWIRKKS